MYGCQKTTVFFDQEALFPKYKSENMICFLYFIALGKRLPNFIQVYQTDSSQFYGTRSSSKFRVLLTWVKLRHNMVYSLIIIHIKRHLRDVTYKQKDKEIVLELA